MRKIEHTPPKKKTPPHFFSLSRKKKKAKKDLLHGKSQTPVGDVKRTPQGTIEENIEEAAP